MFPESINKYVNNLTYTIDTIGRSEDEVYIFEDKYILKVSFFQYILRKNLFFYNLFFDKKRAPIMAPKVLIIRFF